MSDFWNSQRPGEREKCYVGVIRLSHMRDNSSSPERQEQIIEEEAKRKGGKIVDWVIDLDVSGSVSPFARPEFGKWLTDTPPKPFDGFIAWKVDRFARSIMDFHELLKWAKDRGKEIISAAENFDLFSTVGQIIVAVLAGLAQMEREAISERIANAREFLRYSGRYGYGTVPYGYRAVARTGGGFELAEDTSQSATIEWIIEAVLAGESLFSIAKALNRDGVLPPALARQERASKAAAAMDRAAPKYKVAERHRGWSSRTLDVILRSPALRGQAAYVYKWVDQDGIKREEMRPLVYPHGHEKAGEFVVRGPALVSAELQQRVVAKLDERRARRGSTGGRRRTKDVQMLFEVLFCGDCGAKMYSGTAGKIGFKRRVYRCSKAPTEYAKNRHKIVTMTAELTEHWVEEQFLSAFGHLEVVEIIHDPGEDHSAEIAEVKKAMAKLKTDRYEHGLFDDEEGEQDFLSRYRDLRNRQTRLEALPSRPAGERRIPTGKSVSSLWTELDRDDRRRMLLDHKVTVTVQQLSSGRRRDWNPERLQMLVNGEPVTSKAA
ncbi:recombinase family protein [Crossiella sp. NPDC003009]